MVFPPRRTVVSVPLLTGSLAFGAMVYLLLPGGVSIINDDFAFYRSIAETLQRHRPWTDDYLEPWAAGLSVLSAGVFRLTRSFTLATYGLMVVLQAAGFLACGRLLLDRGCRPAAAIAGAAAIFSFPFVLQTILEFNTWTIVLPCLLWALWAAKREAWGWFSVVWLAALATRQTSVTWCVLPLAAAWSARREGVPAAAPRFWRPLVAVALGAALFAGLSAGMNLSQAYLHRTLPQLHGFVRAAIDLRLGSLPSSQFAAAAAVFLLSMGAGRWLSGPGRGAGARFGVARLSVGVVALTTLMGFGQVVNIVVYGYHGPAENAYLLLAGLVGAAGLAWGGPFRLRWPVVLTAAASGAAICIHTPLNVQYLLEIGLLGIFAPRPAAADEAAVPAGDLRPWLARLSLAGGGVLLLCHLAWAVDLKLNFDRHLARIRVTEQALRSGRIAIGDCPPRVETLVFWRVVPFLDVAALPRRAVRDFVSAARTPGLAVGFRQSFSSPLHLWPGFADAPPAPGERVLQRASFRCGWFFRGEVDLVATGPGGDAAPTVAAGPPGYHPPPFPLDDAEWRDFIRRPAASETSRPPLRARK